MDRTTLAALLAATMLVTGVIGAAPALASDGSLSVSATANDDGTATVTVTHDNATLEGATVTVETTNGSNYTGTGSYTTDENGTVALPAYEGNGTAELLVTASANNETATTTLRLEGDAGNRTNGTFGQRVAAFVASLDKGNLSVPPGTVIAEFVVANNPGNAPDHAGPPAHAGPPGNDTNESEPGPPDHAGNGTDGGGPPEDPGNGNGGGPPDHAGPPDDEDDEDDSDE